MTRNFFSAILFTTLLIQGSAWGSNWLSGLQSFFSLDKINDEHQQPEILVKEPSLRVQYGKYTEIELQLSPVDGVGKVEWSVAYATLPKGLALEETQATVDWD